MMKPIYASLLVLAALFGGGCSKEPQPGFTADLGIAKNYTPPADAPAEVKEMFNRYDVWIRMDFNDWKEVTNGVLGTDPINRWGAGKIDDDQRSSAIMYSQALLSNVSEKFAKTFFPMEIFFVKTYRGSFWAADLINFGRSRLIVCWPNHLIGALPVTDPANHYYMDSTLTRAIWSALGPMVAGRMATPISEFVLAGKAYDNGEALDKIFKQYEKDRDQDALNKSRDEVARNGGFITIGGSTNFDVDFGEWMKLLVTESYDNIKTQYLDNSPARARKYEVIVKFFNSYGWDIQKCGNYYRQRLGN
ncbi:zinc-binding metallopeptidase [Chitinophaga flava]|nr:hypothetical protein [Chitinophaga flava]